MFVDDASVMPRADIVSDFSEFGRHVFAEPVSPKDASALLKSIRAQRRFDQSLFLTEAEFDANPQYTGVNPGPGRNLLDQYDDRLGFVEQAPMIVEALSHLLGEGYGVLNRKIVCGVPDGAIPLWLKTRIAGNPVNNLGPYVKSSYRDVTYFNGIDFHQDLIDYKDRDADFVTLYVYLHPVTAADAPLHLLDASHVLGASVFPHNLERLNPSQWIYRNGPSGKAVVNQHILTGPAGFTAVWHACTLHGTQPDIADHERISLRYLFERRRGASAAIDKVNRRLKGRLSLADTRTDLSQTGAAKIKHNSVNLA